jgi:hypothetical protein
LKSTIENQPCPQLPLYQRGESKTPTTEFPMSSFNECGNVICSMPWEEMDFSIFYDGKVFCSAACLEEYEKILKPFQVIREKYYPKALRLS